MRSLATRLVPLALALSLVACSGGDGDEGSAPVRDGSRWSGPPRGASDGTVAVDEFNAHVASVNATWTQSPLLAAAEFLRLDRAQAAKTSVVATSRKEGATTRVAVTLNGVLDDSIQSQRYVLSFERRDNGKVVLKSARWSQRCARGRGHRKFEPKDCV